MPNSKQINLEEALEKLWIMLEEKNIHSEAELSAMLPVPLEQLAQQGLVEISADNVRLTVTGRAEAALAIRRHRLSERLFHDIIEADQDDEAEEAACQVEHIVKKGIEGKICQLLGHPETCPHGKPIPPGECCRKARESRDKLVVPLTGMKPGEQGTIAYIKAGDSKKLQKLMVMGVLPGNPVELNASFPSFVFTIDYSQYAVDADMAAAIIVRRAS